MKGRVMLHPGFVDRNWQVNWFHWFLFWLGDGSVSFFAPEVLSRGEADGLILLIFRCARRWPGVSWIPKPTGRKTWAVCWCCCPTLVCCAWSTWGQVSWVSWLACCLLWDCHMLRSAYIEWAVRWIGVCVCVCAHLCVVVGGVLSMCMLVGHFCYYLCMCNSYINDNSNFYIAQYLHECYKLRDKLFIWGGCLYPSIKFSPDGSGLLNCLWKKQTLYCL